INDNFELQQALLIIEEMPYNHTADNIANKLRHIFNQWKINLQEKIIAGVSDNDAKIIKAFQELQIANISYSAHTIHLAVSDGLKINLEQELLKKAKALNLFLVHHDKYQNRFLQIQKILQPTKDTLAPIQDIDTRWNSTYKVLERLLKLKQAIKLLYEAMQKDDNKEIHKDRNNLATLYLTTEEWIRVEELTFILYPFFQATKFLSSSTYSSIFNRSTLQIS
ncbi:14574_t:CDS:1, partial [Funneliformis geosporum]